MSACGGSCARTSAQKAVTLPLLRASAISSSTISGPRPVFMMMTPRFIWLIVSLRTIPRVSSVSGQWSDNMSHSRNSSSCDTLIIYDGSCSLVFDVCAMTRIPKALAMRATAIPIFPSPTIPIVSPASSVSGVSTQQKSSERLQRPCRSSRA